VFPFFVPEETMLSKFAILFLSFWITFFFFFISSRIFSF
jgi:hypothetical protein